MSWIDENINTIIHGDCLEVMKNIPEKSIDLVIADPPYFQKNTTTGGNSKFSKSFQNMNTELQDQKLNINLGVGWCKEIPRMQERINIYIWCNKAQIIQYLDYFVKELCCSWDILNWKKDNAPPTFNNKYLTDKEYCLYFRRGGYCNPKDYKDAQTIFNEPINIKDKNLYNHPTIKPEKIIRTLIRNSSRVGGLILDPFGGSGTTAICAEKEQRNFILIEKNKKHYKTSVERLNNAKAQMKLFTA